MFSGLWVILGIIALVVVGALLWLAGAYNSLVALQNRFKTAFSQIDVQLKRRHDLIPNLIETAKGYLSHEKGTLEAVTQARNKAISAMQSASANPGNPSAMAGLAAAETQLNGVLGRLFAVAEAYPDLKANQNMIALQQELSATENQIASARQIFNNSIMQYNTTLQSFPTNLVANAMGFAPAQLFELESDKERQVPQVSF
jgi:LemA protein